VLAENLLLRLGGEIDSEADQSRTIPK
jgi:hypothetical protein